MNAPRIDGCRSGGLCPECFNRGRRVPLLLGLAECADCGSKTEPLAPFCCDATREQWERNEACRTCRAVTAAKAGA